MAQEEEKTVKCMTTKVITHTSLIVVSRKSRLLQGQSSNSSQRGSTQLRRLQRWVSNELNVQHAKISIGGIVTQERHAEIPSNDHIVANSNSCEGTYSFIGNGIGKGKKITYAEAWQGIISYPHFLINVF
jgi:hypothetical protein